MPSEVLLFISVLIASFLGAAFRALGFKPATSVLLALATLLAIVLAYGAISAWHNPT